jgi:hypothetical protein
VYAYFGDDKGFIKIWDFTNLFEVIDVQKTDKNVSEKVSFNPKRKMFIDASNVVNSLYLQ